MPFRITAISGSLRASSTTTALLVAIADRVADRLGAEVETRVVELSDIAVDLAAALVSKERSDAVASALGSLDGADLVIVGTPIYRGSYTGLFKVFFDLVGQDALAGTPVLLAAGGGNDLHSLAIDHELRPLFAFFRAATLPVGVYARSADFADGAVAAESLRAAIDAAVAASVPYLSGAGLPAA